MKDLQTLLAPLAADAKSGRYLPTAQLTAEFEAARPLGGEELRLLAQCIDACSEQLYEHYRALIDLFRAEIRTAQPDAETIRLGIALGILDDEEWEG